MFAFARRMMRFSVAAVASATGLLAHEPPPQQPRDAPAVAALAVAGQALEPAAALRQQYESYWKLESKRLVKLLDLSPDDATILSEKVVSALAELAAENAKKRPADGEVIDPTSSTTDALQKAVRQALSKSLSADQLKRHQIEANQRTDFHRNATVRAITVALEDSVALDSDQVTQTQALLVKHYDESWINVMRSLNVTPDLSRVPLTTILPQQQQKTLKVMASRGGMMFPGPGQNDGEKSASAKFRDNLKVSVAAHIETIQRELKLNAVQSNKLSVLAEGIQTEVCENRSDALRKVQEMTVGRQRAMDPSVFEYASAAPGVLFISHRRWMLFVGKIFDEDQKQTFGANRNLRQERRRKQVAEMVTIGMGQTFGLDVDQMKSLTRLVESNFSKPMSGLKFSHGFYKAILNIPLEEILAIVGDENMPAWKSQMDQGRRLLEQTKNEQEHDNG
ncbi:MAG: hypothetical protein VB878_14515 [Pirellulaceae bacterium]